MRNCTEHRAVWNITWGRILRNNLMNYSGIIGLVFTCREEEIFLDLLFGHYTWVGLRSHLNENGLLDEFVACPTVLILSRVFYLYL